MHKTTLAGLAISLMTLALGPAAVVLSSPPSGAGPVLVVAPPWRDLGRIVTGAAGQIIGPAQAPLAMMASFPAGVDPALLRRLGAWWVLDAGRIAQICGGTDA